MYKCCWNCANGFVCVAPTLEATDRFNASKRFCYASYPVSQHAETHSSGAIASNLKYLHMELDSVMKSQREKQKS